MKREKSAGSSALRMRLTEKIAEAPFGDRLLMHMDRLKAKRSQTPSRFYCRCQYFSEADPYSSCIGYLATERKEASFGKMKFIRCDGTPVEKGDIDDKVLQFAIRPYGSGLMYIRRRAVDSGADIFSRVISNTREPILYYKLDGNGKITTPPRRLTERAAVFRAQTCYLFTDENRSFTLYLQGSRNELWEMPTY